MAVREIRLYGDPVLRTVADPVETFGEATRALATDLLDTLDLPGRAGVAAPQIGVPLRVIAFNLDGRAGHLVNPRLEVSGRPVVADEACLSAPGRWWPLARPVAAVARGRDMHGRPVTVRAVGMLARVLQHEVDHLDGVLFSDHLPAEERERFLAALS